MNKLHLIFLLVLALHASCSTPDNHQELAVPCVFELRTEQLIKQVLYQAATASSTDLTFYNSTKEIMAMAPTEIDRSSFDRRYDFQRKLGSGAFGTTWLAFRKGHKRIPLVIKAIKITSLLEINYWSARRELYFGRILNGIDGVGRFVEAVVVEDVFYLVFQFEGVSLSDIMYKAIVGGSPAFPQTQWWRWMKSTPKGQWTMKILLYQLLTSISVLHKLNVAHFDLKPENVVVCFKNGTDGICQNKALFNNEEYQLKIIDFGMSMDAFAFDHLQGKMVGTTTIYMSPESLEDRSSWVFTSISSRRSYDMWTIGVIFMELILGDPDVFQVTLPQNQARLKKLYTFNSRRFLAFEEMCIDVYGYLNFLPHCSVNTFSEYIKKRDPLNIGFPDSLAQDLIKELLRWDPASRITALQALKHPYFRDVSI